MSRLMSVAFTEQAVRDRTKTVTRRKGWWEDKNGRRILKPGDTLTLCRKVMGRKKGEALVRICDVEVVSVIRCELGMVHTPGELTSVGFPDLELWPGPYQGAHIFIERYFKPQGLGWCDTVTRIRWRYLDGDKP